MSQPQRGLIGEDAVWQAIDRERRSLADLLDDLDATEWEAPSLCTGWRVLDVAAHLALAHTGPVAAAVGAVRARGSFDRMVHDTAVRHARRTSTGELTAQLRAMVGSRRHAPGITPLEPLIDVLVHGQDIAVPLGRPRAVPVDAAVTAVTRAWTCRWPISLAFRAPQRLSGLRLTATDVDWSVGDGAEVEGPVAALLLLVTGRRSAALPLLTGPGTARLAAAG